MTFLQMRNQPYVTRRRTDRLGAFTRWGWLILHHMPLLKLKGFQPVLRRSAEVRTASSRRWVTR